MIPEEKRGCLAWAGELRLGGGVFRRRGVTSAGGQMVLVAVLDLNGRRNRLESQLVGILAEPIQAVNGK